ncbi:outer membrane protein assembly factor BamD [bacterium]|nr:outer membrane protein assembly factor BamD [bacterium]
MNRPNSLMKRAVLILVLVAALAALAGCSRGRRYEDVPMDAAWAKIMDKFNDGKYLDAADRLEIFLINHAGSSLSDSAQFILGECHFEMKEYIIAASEYQQLFVQYPQSTLAPEAEFKMAVSFRKLSPKYSLDQEFTQKAIDTFQLFIEDFPNSPLVGEATESIQELREKLAHKEFFNGLLYLKMDEYSSARIYFDLVLNNYYDTSYAPKAQYNVGVSYQDQKEWQEAMAAYTTFLDKFGEHDLAELALSRMNDCRERLATTDRRERAKGMLQPAGEMEEDSGLTGS